MPQTFGLLALLKPGSQGGVLEPQGKVKINLFLTMSSRYWKTFSFFLFRAQARFTLLGDIRTLDLDTSNCLSGRRGFSKLSRGREKGFSVEKSCFLSKIIVFLLSGTFFSSLSRFKWVKKCLKKNYFLLKGNQTVFQIRRISRTNTSHHIHYLQAFYHPDISKTFINVKLRI